LYYCGVVAYAVMITYFAYFTYSSYEAAINQQYISLTDSGGYCSTVSISVSGSYLGDSGGNWQGSPDFVYAFGKYELSLSNFEGTELQYTTMMNFFNQVLVDLGNQGQNESLPFNLARWSSFIRYYAVQDPTLTNFSSIGYGQLQYIQLAGSPETIFNLEFQQIVFGSASGYCGVTGYTQFDFANARAYTGLNYTNFALSPTCLACGIPNSLGYSSVLDDSIFMVDMDVRSFMTAFSVNTGILNINSLYRTGSQIYNFEFDNVSYVAGQYYDIRYSAMKPVLCMYNITEAPPNILSTVCFYLIGSTLAYPVFNHFGTDISNPIYCSCENGAGHTAACNAFNLMAGLIYYPVPLYLNDIEKTLVTQLTDLVKLYAKFPNYKALNYAAYNASWGAAAVAYGRKSATTQSSSWIKGAFQFCNIKSATCGMATFHFTDQSSQLVSIYKYSLGQGSCSDSFTIPLAQW
jgi:hypothetical protein